MVKKVKKQHWYFKNTKEGRLKAEKKSNAMIAKGYIVTVSFAGKKNPLTKKIGKLNVVSAWE